MRWAELEAGQPRLAEVARERLIKPGVVLVATIGTEGEFKLRGSARLESDPARLHRYASAVAASLGWSPAPGRFHLFEIDIDQVTFVRYDPATGDQFLTSWPPAREFVRRGTSATSVGEPEPITDLLTSG